MLKKLFFFVLGLFLSAILIQKSFISKTSTYIIEINPLIFEEKFSCLKQYKISKTSKRIFKPKDLRFFVYDLKLYDNLSQAFPALLKPVHKWQEKDIALLDFANNEGSCNQSSQETNSRLILLAPPGNYSGISFKIGLPKRINHQNPLYQRPPLNKDIMHLSRKKGYRFFHFEGIIDKDNEFKVSLESSGCQEISHKKYNCEDTNESFFKIQGRLNKKSILNLSLEKLFPNFQEENLSKTKTFNCSSNSNLEPCKVIHKSFFSLSPKLSSLNSSNEGVFKAIFYMDKVTR